MAKKKTKNKGDTFVMSPTRSIRRRSVDIKKASNGFVVSSYQDDAEKLYIAKTQKEANVYANKLLKM